MDTTELEWVIVVGSMQNGRNIPRAGSPTVAETDDVMANSERQMRSDADQRNDTHTTNAVGACENIQCTRRRRRWATGSVSGG